MRIFCEGDADKRFIVGLLQHLESIGQLKGDFLILVTTY